MLQSIPERKKAVFAALNEMSLCLSLKEETALQEKMKKYVTDSDPDGRAVRSDIRKRGFYGGTCCRH